VKPAVPFRDLGPRAKIGHVVGVAITVAAGAAVLWLVGLAVVVASIHLIRSM
jgi:hypothetical protein